MEVKAEVAGTLQTTTIQHVGKKGEKKENNLWQPTLAIYDVRSEWFVQ